MVVLRPVGRERVATTGARPVLAASGWVATVLLALVLGALSVRSTTLVVLLLGALLVGMLVVRPGVAGVLSAASLPFSGPALPLGGLNLGAPDLLLVVALLGWGIRDLLTVRTEDSPPAVRPVALGLVAYATAAALSLVAHPSAIGLLTGLQRGFLLVGALLLGARLVREGLVRRALGGYLLASGVLAVGAVLNSGDDGLFGVQKNPAGGFLAAGLIIAVVLRPYRWWWVVAPLVGVGVVSTQSRGALIGLLAGTAATFVLVRYRERVRVLVAVVVAAVILYLTFENLPASAQTRLRTLSGSSDFAIRYRERFQADALDAFRDHPWLGVGIGNYGGGVRQPGITDPHQVAYFQLAEGGMILLIAFSVLVLVTLVVPLLHVRRTRLAVAAIAVQVSTVVHAFGDVYWVRGTPVVAFVLIGATVAAVAYQQRGDARGDGWEVRRPAAVVDPPVPDPAEGLGSTGRHRRA